MSLSKALAFARLTFSIRGLITEHFQLLVSRSMEEGVWFCTNDTNEYEFHDLATVRDDHPELYATVEKAKSENIALDNRYGPKDIILHFANGQQIEVKKGRMDMAKTWWVRKRSSAATFINLDSDEQSVTLAANNNR
jgi:hypothetical protein